MVTVEITGEQIKKLDRSIWSKKGGDEAPSMIMATQGKHGCNTNKLLFILYGIYLQILQKIKLLGEINEIGAWVGRKS